DVFALARRKINICRSAFTTIGESIRRRAEIARIRRNAGLPKLSEIQLEVVAEHRRLQRDQGVLHARHRIVGPVHRSRKNSSLVADHEFLMHKSVAMNRADLLARQAQLGYSFM